MAADELSAMAMGPGAGVGARPRVKPHACVVMGIVQSVGSRQLTQRLGWIGVQVQRSHGEEVFQASRLPPLVALMTHCRMRKVASRSAGC